MDHTAPNCRVEVARRRLVDRPGEVDVDSLREMKRNETNGQKSKKVNQIL